MTEIISELLHILKHPVLETLKMSPILFLAYLFMEWLEHAEDGKMARFVHKSRRFGPLFGSALGLVPQCGFSGAIASMYATGAVTVGTLLAVLLTTSDEMLPLLVSAKFSVPIILLILGIKFVIGLVVGFIADLIARRRNMEKKEDIHGFCEREHCSCHDGIALSALKHTLKILLIILIISIALHFLVDHIPRDTFKAILNFPFLSEFFASLLGLIPNCAISVLFTQLYLEGALGIGPMLCGLLSNGGIGLLVLFRTNHCRKDSIVITLVLFVSSLILGSVMGLFFGGIL